MTARPLASPLFALLFLPVRPAVAQAAPGPATVETRTVVLTHGKKGGENYKQATVRYPVVRGLASAAAQARANAALGPKEAVRTSLDQMRRDFRENYWLDSVEFKVSLNADNLLSVTYIVQGTGAYTSLVRHYVTVDLKTGRRMRARDLFRPDALPRVRTLLNRLLRADADRAVQKADAEYRADLRDRLKDAAFTPERLNLFSLTPKGVTFHYDFGFPHVILALSPEGRYPLFYSTLKPHFRPGGPLAR